MNMYDKCENDFLLIYDETLFWMFQGASRFITDQFRKRLCRFTKLQ